MTQGLLNCQCDSQFIFFLIRAAGLISRPPSSTRKGERTRIRSNVGPTGDPLTFLVNEPHVIAAIEKTQVHPQ
jgi:hypothetical protein